MPTKQYIDAIHDGLDDEMAADPTPETAMQWVFAEDWPGETPPPWGMTGGHDGAESGGAHG